MNFCPCLFCFWNVVISKMLYFLKCYFLKCCVFGKDVFSVLSIYVFEYVIVFFRKYWGVVEFCEVSGHIVMLAYCMECNVAPVNWVIFFACTGLVPLVTCFIWWKQTPINLPKIIQRTGSFSTFIRCRYMMNCLLLCVIMFLWFVIYITDLLLMELWTCQRISCALVLWSHLKEMQ